MKKGDFFIVIVVAVLFLSWIFMPKGGNTAQIYVDGNLYREVPLTRNDTIVVESEFGKNTVVIENGSVRITDSDCPGKDCELGTIKDGSRSIVCLPNRLTVMIESVDKKDETDVVI